MEYKEFVEKVKSDLPERFSGELAGAAVEETHVSKLQGRSYDGISIIPQDSIMGMTMDMQPYFQMVQEGIPYETVLENAADTAVGRYEGRPDISPNEIGNYAVAKDRLTVQLVGKEKNEEMLRQIPHHDLEDMSVIYRLQIRSDGYGEAAVTVTNAMLEQYGVTAEQLHRDAVESAAVRHPYEIKTMSEILSEFSDGMIIPEGELPLYVATNESRLNGAGVLSYPGFMEAAADRLNGSFYILPSSVHEVILLPENSAFSVQELQAMVQDINAAEVSPEEQLSNHVYHYDSKERVFELADKYEARKQDKAIGKDRGRTSVLETLHEHQKECAEKPRKMAPAHHREDASR